MQHQVQHNYIQYSIVSSKKKSDFLSIPAFFHNFFFHPQMKWMKINYPWTIFFKCVFGKKKFEKDHVLGDQMHKLPWEQSCSKFYVIITFSYEFD
jgi:hypothetical protein